MVELNQFVDLISLLVCPYCRKMATLSCQDWREVGGGFSTSIHCSKRSCDFFFRFSSTSPLLSNYHRRDAPSKLVVAWGMHRLGFDQMESVWALAGGVPPISKTAYTKMMKNLV
jgi:uncharacterized protein YbaR (Trm112 family)